MEFGYSREELSLIHSFMFEHFTFKAFKAKVGPPSEDLQKWEDIFALAVRCDTVIESFDTLLDTAHAIYNSILLQICANPNPNNFLTEKESHKFTVKLLECYHWSFRQPCGYGSNRQHQLLIKLDMPEGKKEFASQQKLTRWSIVGVVPLLEIKKMPRNLQKEERKDRRRS